MRYIIMADGNSARWNRYMGVEKHLIEIDGEPILKRTIRLLREHDEMCEIIVTSHNERYEFEGSVRYEPENNVLEIDRFTKELISDNVCFLYGDTYYSEKSILAIVGSDVEDVLFFGNEKSIVAVKIKDGKLFKRHVNRVRELFIDGEIDSCKGWQVYRSVVGLPLGEERFTSKFIAFDDKTTDFNRPEDYEGSVWVNPQTRQ